MQYGNLEVLNDDWFTGGNGEVTGIITCKDVVTEEVKVYVGSRAKMSVLVNQDIEYILDFGGKMHVGVAERLYKALKGKEK